MSNAASEPSVSQVEASEVPDILSVPVTVETPVRTQELPAPSGSHYAVTFPNTTDAVKFLSRDERRKRVFLLAATDAVWVGIDQQSVQSKTAFRLAIGVPISICHIEDLWAMPDASATAILSVIVELWTD